MEIITLNYDHNKTNETEHFPLLHAAQTKTNYISET